MDIQEFRDRTVGLLKDSPLGYFMEIEVEDNYKHPEVGAMTRFVVCLPTPISWSAINSKILDDEVEPEKIVSMIEQFIRGVFKEDFLAKEVKRTWKLMEG